MNKETNKLVPELRFPEFVEEGEWMENIVSQIAEYENGKAHEQDIVEQGNYVVVNSKFISTDGEVRKFSNSALCLAKKNEILMVLSDVPNGRAIAKCFYVDKDDFYTVNQRICKLTPVNTDGKLLLYLLNRNQFFLAFDDGVKQTNLRNEDVLNCPIILPKNAKEQQKIASCLSSLDDVIASHSHKLDALKTHKKGLMQNLFPKEGETVPKWRFKEFVGNGDWVEKELGAIAAFVNEKTQLENLSINTYVSTENLLPDYAGVSISSKLPDYGNFTKYRKGDVLISNIRPYLKKVWFADKDGACSNDVIVIQAKSIIMATFLSCLLKNDAFINYIMKGAEGVKMPRGDKDSIREYPILFPNGRGEQQKIASCLSSLDELITAQSEKIEQLKLHKKGLLQGLFPVAG